MTLQEAKDWADIFSKVAIPVALLIVGFMLTRTIEATKAEVTRASDFIKRWADAFFDASNEFLQTVERYAATLATLQSAPPNSAFATKLQEDAWEYAVRLPEFELRVKRLAYYALTNGPKAVSTAKAVFDQLNSMLKERKGSLDLSLQNSFSQASHDVHAEILRIH